MTCFTPSGSGGELAADLVGDYIFSDIDFVRNLKAGDRNLFQRIYDEIKHLVKLATAGSKEARELEKAKKLFADVYREAGAEKSTANDGGVQYSISKDVNGNSFVDVTEDIFDANNGESIARVIQKVIAEKFHNIIDVHGQKIQINKTTNDEFRRSNSANELMSSNPQAYNDKLKTIANADEILRTAKNWIGEEIKHHRKDDIVEFARGNVAYRVGFNGYIADVIVGTRKNGSAVLYDLVNIYEKEITEAPVTVASQDNSQRRQDASAEEIVTQPSTTVKRQFSISNAENVKKAEEYFGTTYKISEAGYLLTDGRLLDFSGKHEGGPGGYRSVDHRDIVDALDEDYGGDSYSGGMIRFMQEGNIRLSPESGGINLSVKPNKAQMMTLDRFITSFRGEVILDIDDADGNTVVSVEYPARTYSKRVLNDITAYLEAAPRDHAWFWLYQDRSQQSSRQDVLLCYGLSGSGQHILGDDGVMNISLAQELDSLPVTISCMQTQRISQR